MALLFDMQLKFWMVITLSKVPEYLDEIEAEVLTWPGINKVTHKYGGMQFNYKGIELGHIHSNGWLDMLFTRKIKQELLKDRRICDHHTFKKSGWISFYIRDANDRIYAEQLLRIAWLKNQQAAFDQIN